MQKKFEEKAYPRDLITNAFLSNKTQLSKNKKDNPTDMVNTVRFVSTFNIKYRAISKIIYKHYDILKLDHILAPVLPPKPQVTFRRSRTVKNIIAPSKLMKPKSGPLFDIRTYFDNRIVIFQCQKSRCLTCQSIPHGCSEITTNRDRSIQIKQFITCSTKFIIYVLRCSCGLLYIGRTIHPVH